jgi:predicted O-methyltransferase YrrM
MRDEVFPREPVVLAGITVEGKSMGFRAASEPGTGALLQVLAASKPGGRLLELGTGTGVGTAWLLNGMDSAACLDTVDNDPAVVAVARRHLGDDSRVRFHIADGEDWLRDYTGAPFDLIFADAWPGKFSALTTTLGLLAPGGLYVIDDLLPQPNWPESHSSRIEPLLCEIEGMSELACVRLPCASGLAVVAKRANPGAREPCANLTSAPCQSELERQP